MRRPALRLVLASAVLATPLIASSAADAVDSIVGAAVAPTAGSCVDVTYLQTTSPSGSYAVPSDGVVTSYRMTTDSAPPAGVGLRLGRQTATGYSVVGASPVVTIPSSRTTEMKVRVPAKAGDVLGYYVGYTLATPDCYNGSAQATYSVTRVTGDVASGPATGATVVPGIQLSVEATVEPDADGDGFGDTTQDLCATNATTQGVCPPPVPTTAPVTTITTVKAKKAVLGANGKPKRAKVTVSFSVSRPGTSTCAVDGRAAKPCTSTCAVDGRAAKPCTSPFRFKAKVGKHTVTVTSADSTGAVGATVTTEVKVKVAKRK